jgi:hypothetical protein
VVYSDSLKSVRVAPIGRYAELGITAMGGQCRHWNCRR